MRATDVWRGVEQQLILDRYRPLEDLGEGAFGTVVLAWDTRMQRRVAIKRLPLPLDSRGRPHRPRGLSEARTAAMLNHPNIITVFDFDTDSDEAFIVMEYADGASLSNVLEDVDGHQLTPDETAAVVEAVASALAFAHHNGVLHLDIKPDNVLVMSDGRVKVADFGIAELSSLAGHGDAWGGTLGYMPLEQLAGDTVDQRTDEWALAALAYEILTGREALSFSSAEEALARMPHAVPVLPSALDRSLNPALDDALLAALDPEPDERYPTVEAFRRALAPLLGDAHEGRESLAGLVAPYVDDEPDDDVPLSEIGLWDRLGTPLGSLLLRFAAATEASWLVWSGLVPFGLEPAAHFAVVALVALGAALAPGLGIGLGLGCFIAGLLKAGLWLVAGAMALAGGAWWWSIARHSHAASVLPLSAPVLAFARIPFLQPLLAGFALNPLPAALSALAGGALTMLASAASAQGSPYLAVWPAYALDVWNAGLAGAGVSDLLASPHVYMALLGWPASAALMSFICARATRMSAALGAIAASSVLALSYYLAEMIAKTGGQVGGYTGAVGVISLGASFVLMLGVIALGPPMRAEEEPAAWDDTEEAA